MLECVRVSRRQQQQCKRERERDSATLDNYYRYYVVATRSTFDCHSANFKMHGPGEAEPRNFGQKMTQNLRANALQNVISILIRSDTDGDFHIDDAEIDDLIARMERLNGVDINDNAVRKVIKQQHNGDINALMEILKDVMNKDPEERTHEKLFTVKDEEEEKQ